jgi:hypothetical protein
MFKELLEDKDSRQLKEAYDKFKADLPKGTSLREPEEFPKYLADCRLAFALNDHSPGASLRALNEWATTSTPGVRSTSPLVF